LNCRSCGAAIVFLRTKGGKSIPVNAATVKPGEQVFDAEIHRTHFADCPNAKQHRQGAAHARAQERR
jgi:hypothetical protein